MKNKKSTSQNTNSSSEIKLKKCLSSCMINLMNLHLRKPCTKGNPAGRSVVWHEHMNNHHDGNYTTII